MLKTSARLLPYEPGYMGHWEAEKRRQDTLELRKPALYLSDVVRQPCSLDYRNIAVSALPARLPDLLGRAERSSPMPHGGAPKARA
jgi:hypothetical protein